MSKLVKIVTLSLITTVGILQAIMSIQGCKPILCGNELCPAICEAPGINLKTIIYLLVSLVAIYLLVKLFRTPKSGK